MRYSRDHKERARERLLERSACHAKQHGFAASGVDSLAAAAGVTAGSLYKHFGGKADLFAALIRAELQRTARRFAAVPPGDAEAAGRAVDAYLSLNHVRHPGQGCPLPALAAEVARADDAARGAFEQGLRDVHTQLQQVLGSGSKAWALIAQNVGAVMLARAMLGPKTQRELLAAAQAEAGVLLAPRKARPRAGPSRRPQSAAGARRS